MKNLDLSHHAYVVAGARDSILASLLNTFQNKFQIKTDGNPDCTFVHFESVGIDESRLIKEMQGSMPLQGKRKIFVVSTNSITVQAQNAMLKIFEEPTQSTHFFIVVPSASFFIDTLLSRIVKLDFEENGVGAKELDVKKFLSASYPERLKIVEKFLKAYKDSKENKSLVQTFISQIEIVLAKDIKKNKGLLEKILEIKKNVFDTSASLKILLETLALCLPVSF